MCSIKVHFLSWLNSLSADTDSSFVTIFFGVLQNQDWKIIYVKGPDRGSALVLREAFPNRGSHVEWNRKHQSKTWNPFIKPPSAVIHGESLLQDRAEKLSFCSGFTSEKKNVCKIKIIIKITLTLSLFGNENSSFKMSRWGNKPETSSEQITKSSHWSLMYKCALMCCSSNTELKNNRRKTFI